MVSEDEEAIKISKILNPIKTAGNKVRDYGAKKVEDLTFGKRMKLEMKQEQKEAREREQEWLAEMKKNEALSAEQRLAVHNKLKRMKKEDRDKKWHGKALNKGKNMYDKLFAGSSAIPNIGLLFLFALTIHVVDWATRFNRQAGGMLYQMFGLYIFLALFAILFVYKSGISQDTWKYAGLSLIAFSLPFITKYFQQDWVGAVLLATPVWVIYLMLNPGGSRAIARIGKIYISFWVILGVIALFSKITFPETVSAAGVNPIDGWNYLVDAVSRPIKNTWKGIATLPIRIEETINKTVGLDYYTGQVEGSRQTSIGVYLEDLRAADPVFYTDMPVTIWASLRGKSFQGKILVESSCVTDDGIYGKIDPDEPLEIFYEEQNTLGCRFEYGLSKGTHRIIFSSVFNFETWGYLTYTFVDKTTYRSFYAQGRDINRELDIDKRADPIYTNGPVAIGMLSLDQPISVDVDNPQALPAFGVTLENRWSQGKIERVEKFEIRTPEEMNLVNCDREPTQDSPRLEEGFNVYEFRLQNPRELFTSVTCRMKIADSTTASKFLGTGQKAIKTFVVIAEYIYNVEKQTTIKVEE